MVEELPAVLYVADFGADATWHYVSPRIQELLGYSAQEWLADSSLWMSHIHPDDRLRVIAEEDFGGRRAIGARGVSEYRMRTRDGREVWIRDEGVVIGNERDDRAASTGESTPASRAGVGALGSTCHPLRHANPSWDHELAARRTS